MAAASLKLQMVLAANIMNFYVNSTTKVGAARQTLFHFQTRLGILERYWEAFVTRHHEILSYADDLSKEEYFVKSVYDQTEDNYTGTKALILDHITALTPQGPAAAQTGNDRVARSSEQSVRDKEAIPKVAKLQHLLNAVQGPVVLRLKGMEITAANFDVAWNKLVRRYNNQRIRLHNALESLMQLPLMKSRTADELTNLIDRTEEAVRSLQELR
ncbi:hypothetical protein TKK_0014434 [Trichogramma kaykai]|uniref:Uncharacterized protein n=1 Tax=Trichogramma kaykai TaxID=54128 RepID=A0ABD2WD99_9HYME